MKVFLINPDYMIYGDPPLGLAYLAAYIREKCSFAKVKILDQISEKEILNIVKREQPEIIGLTSVSGNYYYVKILAKKIGLVSPKSLRVIGGVHITTQPEAFKDSPFQIAVRGEGEIAFSKFLKSFNQNGGINGKELRKIDGLMFREDTKIIDTGLSKQIEDINKLPMPARDLLDMDYYSLPKFLSGEDWDPFGSMLTSRGCPYDCKFCSSSCFWLRKIRFFSAERVVNEIEILYKKYHYKKIYIYDDLFSINKERVREIIRLMKEKDLIGKIKFYVYGRANVFDEEMAKLLKEMGVVSVDFGLESGSEKILDYLKNHTVNVKDNERAVKIAKKYGIRGGGFFMLGSPHETLKDMEETYNFIKENCKDSFIIYQVIAFPGTEIWDYAIKNKLISKNYYEDKPKEFIGVDTGILLSKEVSKEDFKRMFYKIRGLHINKKRISFLKRMLTLKPEQIKKFFSIKFIKKVFNLRIQFIKRVLNRKS